MQISVILQDKKLPSSTFFCSYVLSVVYHGGQKFICLEYITNAFFFLLLFIFLIRAEISALVNSL